MFLYAEDTVQILSFKHIFQDLGMELLLELADISFDFELTQKLFT